MKDISGMPLLRGNRRLVSSLTWRKPMRQPDKMASFETFTGFASEADCLFSCQNISGTGESEWVWCCYGLLWTLYCHKHRYCDVTMKWPLLFHGMRADVSEAPNNTLTTRMHGDYRSSIDRFFVGFNAICYAFLRNNPIYIEGRNCSSSAVPVLLNKSSGLRPSGLLIKLLAWLATSCARG